MIPYARLGAPDGLRVSRSTFAVMLKYNEGCTIFENLIDEVDLMSADL